MAISFNWWHTNKEDKEGSVFFMGRKTDVQFLMKILNISSVEAEEMLKNDAQKAINILWQDSEWYELEHQEVLKAFDKRIKTAAVPINQLSTLSLDEMKKSIVG